jgi:hypothetical protein
MSKILDLELTARVGALDAETAEAIENHATAAFLWRGLSQLDALDLARGLHWLAVGHREDCTAPDMIAALALGPLPAPVRDRLGAHLHSTYVAGEARQRSLCPPDRLGLGDGRLL